MKPKEIQEILEFIAQSGLEEVNIETDTVKLSTKKSYQPTANNTPQILSVPTPVAAPAAAKIDIAVAQEPISTVESNYKTIKSPMIGTFYRSPGPNEDIFVNIGDTISKGTTVCIIEAMKLFNEIESEIQGKIVKVLVQDATPVEYDQPLFVVDPS